MVVLQGGMKKCQRSPSLVVRRLNPTKSEIDWHIFEGSQQKVHLGSYDFMNFPLPGNSFFFADGRWASVFATSAQDWMKIERGGDLMLIPINIEIYTHTYTY